jgi:hypothetical protein
VPSPAQALELRPLRPPFCTAEEKTADARVAGELIGDFESARTGTLTP